MASSHPVTPNPKTAPTPNGGALSTNQPHPLVGHWFITEHPDGTAHWAGKIRAVEGDHVIVELIDWFIGALDGTRKLVPLADVRKWNLFENGKVCGDYYNEVYAHRRNPQPQNNGN